MTLKNINKYKLISKICGTVPYTELEPYLCGKCTNGRGYPNCNRDNIKLEINYDNCPRGNPVGEFSLYLCHSHD